MLSVHIHSYLSDVLIIDYGGFVCVSNLISFKSYSIDLRQTGNYFHKMYPVYLIKTSFYMISTEKVYLFGRYVISVLLLCISRDSCLKDRASVILSLVLFRYVVDCISPRSGEGVSGICGQILL